MRISPVVLALLLSSHGCGVHDFSGRYEAEVDVAPLRPSAAATSHSTRERLDIERDAAGPYRVRLSPKGRPECELIARREHGYELAFEPGQRCTRGGVPATLTEGHAGGGPGATKPDAITLTLAWTSSAAEGTTTWREDLHVAERAGCL